MRLFGDETDFLVILPGKGYNDAEGYFAQRKGRSLMADERLLIVDDELAIRMALETAFARERMEVSEASCGTEALALLKTQEFDLIVLDIMMEDIDGYAILQQLRADGVMTPVLMLSGKQEETDQVLGLGMGADDYLTKPFHLSVLIQKAKALIRRNRVYSHQKNNGVLVGAISLRYYEAEMLQEWRAPESDSQGTGAVPVFSGTSRAGLYHGAMHGCVRYESEPDLSADCGPGSDRKREIFDCQGSGSGDSYAPCPFPDWH